MAVINPFDFFVEPYAETLPVRLCRRAGARAAPYLEHEHGGRRARAPSCAGVRRARARRRVDFLVELNQRVQRDDRATSSGMEPGRADARGDAGAAARGSCRDIGLAARADPAPARPRRALRVRLPDPAQRRHRSRSTGRRAPTPTSPTCTPGPRSICPGAGWIGLDATSGLLCGEGHICRSPRTPHYRVAPRRSPARSSLRRSSFDFDMAVDADREDAARHQAVHGRGTGQRSTRSASRSMPTCRRRMCA